MKQNYIIPVFISHKGCPNQCTFCNQRKISGSLGEINLEEIAKEIDEWIEIYNNISIVGGGVPDDPDLHRISNSEIAFFGGSFTGIETKTQIELLELANRYINQGLIHSIRISTRPDYINQEILNILKKYNVKTIELGIQSMDDEVLKQAKRGHTSSDVEKACKLIIQNEFVLGVQVMVGLKGSTKEIEIETCKKLIALKPQIARIYPVLVIKDTELEQEYNCR